MRWEIDKGRREGRACRGLASPAETSAMAIADDGRPIPDHLMFIWFGRALPAFARFAIRSASDQNPAARISVFHADDLTGAGDLALDTRIAFRRIDIDRLLASAAAVAVQRGQSLAVDRLHG